MKLPYGEETRTALIRGEPGAIEKALACLAVTWADLDGIPAFALHSAAVAQLHNKPFAGCALDLVLVLRHSPQGRKALQELGFDIAPPDIAPVANEVTYA